MKYNISFKNPLTHFFTVQLKLENITRDYVTLQLPIWRPGRYEAANYAKNVRGFIVNDNKGQVLNFTKTTHSTWKIDTKGIDALTVTYDYWAFKMDAGNSLYDEEQVYINFINCMVYDTNRMNEACTVDIELPKNYMIACGLEKNGSRLKAKDYYELVDSPMIAAENLEHHTYEINNCIFHLWLNGYHDLNINKLIVDFKKFTEVQMDVMEGFPEKDYHFILHILPYKHYHGVEHHDSTVICLGPGEALGTDEMYSQLMGISSHELFHAWNIIRIRPREIMPYQFNKEVVFPTGYVAEGFTTYYGDLFLVRGGTFDKHWYFNELNTLLKRHFSNFGRLNYSVVDSSIDLWIDGYAITTPERKSSIYVEGAMVALCLDLMLRKNSGNEASLDDVMRHLWKNYGEPGIGYTYEDVQNIAEEIYGSSLKEFFKDHVKGKASKKPLIDELLNYVGCQLQEKDSEKELEKYFGVRVSDQNGVIKIAQIAPGSVGEQHFSVNDEILSINGKNVNMDELDQMVAESYELKIRRNSKDYIINLKAGDERYFNQVLIQPLPNPTESQYEAFRKWAGCEL